MSPIWLVLIIPSVLLVRHLWREANSGCHGCSQCTLSCPSKRSS